LSEGQNFEWRTAASSPSAAARSTSNFFSSSIWTLVTCGSFGAVRITAARPSSVCEPQGHVPGLRLRSWGMSPTSAPTLLRPATLPIWLQVRVRTSGRERGGARNSTCGRSGRSGRSGRCWSRVLPCRMRDEQSVVQAASAWCEPREESSYLVAPHLCTIYLVAPHLCTIYPPCMEGGCGHWKGTNGAQVGLADNLHAAGAGLVIRQESLLQYNTPPHLVRPSHPPNLARQSVVSRHGVVWYVGISRNMSCLGMPHKRRLI